MCKTPYRELQKMHLWLETLNSQESKHTCIPGVHGVLGKSLHFLRPSPHTYIDFNTIFVLIFFSDYFHYIIIEIRL